MPFPVKRLECLEAALVAPLPKERHLWGSRFHTRTISALCRDGYMRINQRRKGRLEAVITRNGEAKIKMERAPKWPRPSSADQGELWTR